MPFKIVRNDITRMKADAIVNTANPNPMIGAGTDLAIYRAAGQERLLKEREKIGKIKRGQAAITPAFDLDASYIIHTVGPVWRGGQENEENLLRFCYKNSLKLAKKYKCKSIAFPLISTGVYGIPKDLALKIVIDVVSHFLMKEDMMIYLVVFDQESTRLSERMFCDVEAYIDNRESREIHEREFSGTRLEANYPESYDRRRQIFNYDNDMDSVLQGAVSTPRNVAFTGKEKRSLEDVLKQQDETFQQMLLRLIKEKGMTGAQAYKKANQGKQLFSRIKNDINYQPKKKTAFAFALALELNLDQAKDLLGRAGFAFSPSNSFDKAMQYFIETKNYNIYEIEIILYDLGLESLCNY